MKKKFFTLAALSLCMTLAVAQTINLPAPNKSKKTATVMEALATRHSERAFSAQKLSDQELSDLLWAACGKNREDGKLTAPTAMNRQEIRVFVFTDSKVSEYLPQTNQLRQVATGDHRNIVAGRQEFAKSAPVSLVIVADMDKFKSNDQRAQTMVSVDAGIVCQNINIYCEAVGLVTVPRATMDHDAIRKLLGLNENQILLLNNPVGYKAK